MTCVRGAGGRRTPKCVAYWWSQFHRIRVMVGLRVYHVRLRQTCTMLRVRAVHRSSLARWLAPRRVRFQSTDEDITTMQPTGSTIEAHSNPVFRIPNQADEQRNLAMADSNASCVLSHVGPFIQEHENDPAAFTMVCHSQRPCPVV